MSIHLSFNVKCEILVHLASNARYEMSIHLASSVRCETSVHLAPRGHVLCVTMIGSYTKKLVPTAFMASGS